MKKTIISLAVVLAAFANCHSSILAANDPWPYWDMDQFTRLAALVPELKHPRLLSIPNKESQSLWEKGQMRVHQGPWDTLLGDFTNDGRNDIAVILAVGGSDEHAKDAARYLLIARPQEHGWQRVLLQRIDTLLRGLDEDKGYSSGKNHRLFNGELIEHKPTGLIFDAKRHIVGIATGETQRLAKAATMSATPRMLPNGQVAVATQQQYGYVLEKQLILPFCWQPRAGTFQQEQPCWFLDPESEGVLKANGIDPEHERLLMRQQ